MRIGQLFGCVNHCEQERHDELNSISSRTHIANTHSSRMTEKAQTQGSFGRGTAAGSSEPPERMPHRRPQQTQQSTNTRPAFTYCIHGCARVTAERSCTTAFVRDTAFVRESLLPEQATKAPTICHDLCSQSAPEARVLCKIMPSLRNQNNIHSTDTNSVALPPPDPATVPPRPTTASRSQPPERPRRHTQQTQQSARTWPASACSLHGCVRVTAELPRGTALALETAHMRKSLRSEQAIRTPTMRHDLRNRTASGASANCHLLPPLRHQSNSSRTYTNVVAPPPPDTTTVPPRSAITDTTRDAPGPAAICEHHPGPEPPGRLASARSCDCARATRGRQRDDENNHMNRFRLPFREPCSRPKKPKSPGTQVLRNEFRINIPQ